MTTATGAAGFLLGRDSFCQKTPRSARYLDGQIVAISKSVIHAVTPKGPVVLSTSASESAIWKGHWNALSDLRPGDFFYATVLPEPSGRMLIVRLWANIVNYYGLISHVGPDTFDLIAYVPEPAQSATKVSVDSETMIGNGQGSRSDIQAGYFAQVVGVVQRNGVVKAVRIWIYRE